MGKAPSKVAKAERKRRERLVAPLCKMISRAIPPSTLEIPEARLFLTVITQAIRDLFIQDSDGARIFLASDRAAWYLWKLGVDPEYIARLISTAGKYKSWPRSDKLLRWRIIEGGMN